MSEKPMLMSAPMVRAILEGRKGCTRRLLRIQPRWIDRTGATYPDGTLIPSGWYHEDAHGMGPFDPNYPWHYGVRYSVGDIVYVQETWCCIPALNGLKPSEIPDGVKIRYLATDDHPGGITRVSLFMQPRFARIRLKITDVRIELLHSITEQDAILEGIQRLPASGRFVVNKGDQYLGLAFSTAKECFKDLWDYISSKRKKPAPWASNPWVVRYGFEVLEIKN